MSKIDIPSHICNLQWLCGEAFVEIRYLMRHVGGSLHAQDPVAIYLHDYADALHNIGQIGAAARSVRERPTALEDVLDQVRWNLPGLLAFMRTEVPDMAPSARVPALGMLEVLRDMEKELIAPRETDLGPLALMHLAMEAWLSRPDIKKDNLDARLALARQASGGRLDDEVLSAEIDRLDFAPGQMIVGTAWEHIVFARLVRQEAWRETSDRDVVIASGHKNDPHRMLKAFRAMRDEAPLGEKAFCEKD